MTKEDKAFLVTVLTMFASIALILFLCYSAVKDDISKAFEIKNNDTTIVSADTLIVLGDTLKITE